jgi:hypothetical protein
MVQDKSARRRCRIVLIELGVLYVLSKSAKWHCYISKTPMAWDDSLENLKRIVNAINKLEHSLQGIYADVPDTDQY